MRSPTVIVIIGLLAAPVAAAPPDASTIITRMKAALEPARPSVRRLQITVSAQKGAATTCTAAQARKRVGSENAMLTVMLAPENARGIALLIAEGPKDGDRKQLWVPVVRRMRTLVDADAYQAFFNTDFTYADLGFMSVRSTYRLLGEGERAGVPTYEVEEIPKQGWYYGRIVTWVDRETWLPVVREFYDPANELWKVETFDHVTVVDGVRTPLRIYMEDVQYGANIEITVSGVDYDADVPDAFFDPAKLPEAVSSPVWASVEK